MASKTAIATALTSLCVYYRDTRSNDDLRILAGMWFEDLKQISDENLAEACQIARVQSPSFMPTPGKIIDAHRENMESKARNRKALPEQSHEPISIDEMREIRRRNMEKIKNMAGVIGKKI